MTVSVLVYVDAGVRPNPGHAVAAAVAFVGTERIAEATRYLGDYIGNNVAELEAIRLGRQLATDVGAVDPLICSDSRYAVDLARSEGINAAWVPRAIVEDAHVLAGLELEQYLDTPVKPSPYRRLLAHVLEQFPLAERQPLALNGHQLHLNPYYRWHCGRVLPTIDERAYAENARAGGILVWRPYGANERAVTKDKIGVSLAPGVADGCEGIEVLGCWMSAVSLDVELDMVGSRGGRIYAVYGTTWRPLREFVS